MKNALILHGTENTSQDNWFPWLKTQLEQNEYQVWVPDLPQANKPNIARYNSHIFGNNDWKFTQDSRLIGHSSGAVAIFGLLEALPSNITVDTCYLVSAFKNDLGWDALDELFTKPFNFDLIKTKAKHFVFFHSDDDPYCPMDHATFLSEKVGGELIVIPGQKHFSVGSAGEAYRQFPQLLKTILLL
jgi:predicted alpha/beta hydrolase family esterase